MNITKQVYCLSHATMTKNPDTASFDEFFDAKQNFDILAENNGKNMGKILGKKIIGILTISALTIGTKKLSITKILKKFAEHQFICQNFF